MSDVYVPSMASTACPTRFSSVNLHRGKKTAVAVLAVALFAGAYVAKTSAQATAADDTTVGLGYSAGDVDCDDGDAIDKNTLRLASLTWRAVKLHSCFRGLRLATVWLTGTAFSVGLRRRASTLLGRAPAAGGRGGGEVLPGPGGGVASRPHNVKAGAGAPLQAGMIG